jgi:amino acid transporter
MSSHQVEKRVSSDMAGKRSDSGEHQYDSEKQSIPGETEVLKRSLKNRHIQMIAIGMSVYLTLYEFYLQVVGGTIGTGLFLGSGGALAKSGPVGALIG